MKTTSSKEEEQSTGEQTKVTTSIYSVQEAPKVQETIGIFNFQIHD